VVPCPITVLLPGVFSVSLRILCGSSLAPDLQRSDQAVSLVLPSHFLALYTRSRGLGRTNLES
jgi:hypothetical protein